jgi:hypothetical protein
MEILAEREVSDSGEDTVGVDLEDDISFSGRGTHNSVAPEFKAGSRVVYLGQGGDMMCVGYVVTVHGDREGGFYTVNLEGFGGNQIERQHIFPVAYQEEPAPPAPIQLPSNSSSRTSQAKKDRHVKKEYLKQMSELAKIVQQQRLKNKKVEKLFSDFKRKSLQLSLALSQQQESAPSYPWHKFLALEVTGSYYDVSRGKGCSSLGIYADINKCILEVNGVVGSPFKVCESYSEAHLYLREHFVKEKEDHIPEYRSDQVPSLDSQRGGNVPSRTPQGEEKRYFQGQHVGSRRAQCDGRSVER